MSEKTEINVTFLGGAGSIGASCTLVQIGETRLVVDCGIRMNAPERPLPDLSVLSDRNVDAILLTHAHTDHSGGLPVLCDAFPMAPVYATPPTIDLVSILFCDALKTSSMERDGEVPLYSKAQVERVMLNAVPVGFYQQKTVNDITITFLPAAHILGAAMVHLATPAGTVLFSGDYSVSVAGTVPSLDKPSLPVDLLISESTYGNRLHEDRTIAQNRLVQQVREILENNGKVLIPSFAIGRAQEVILILQNALRSKKIPSVPVYVDGMVRDVCTLYKKYETYVTNRLAKQIRNQPDPFFTNGIVPVTTKQMRTTVTEKGPCVIVASSGMLNGGASAFYARKMLGNEHDAILLTGYQDEESPGRALLALTSKTGNKTYELSGETVDVKATVATFNLSAHADRLQMASLIESVHPRTVLLVHGDSQARETLRSSIQIPDCHLLNDGESIVRSFPIRKLIAPVVQQLPEASDEARIRAIVGAPGEKPVRVSDAAQLWFGSKVSAQTIDLFMNSLETLGIARRDDVRRNYCYVLPSETLPNDSDEIQLEKRLKDENPKGKLLEYCMKRKLEYPRFDIETGDGFHYATARLGVNRVELVSQRWKALSVKTAQQLASEELLKCLSVETEGRGLKTVDGIQCDSGQADSVSPVNSVNAGKIIEVESDAYELLKINNPKGKLYEFCSVNKIKVPSFICQTVSGMHLVKIRDHCSSFETDRYSSSVKLISQQAAAEAFLDYLNKTLQSPDSQTGMECVESICTSIQNRKPASDPRNIINKLLQTREFIDFGYTTIGVEQVNNQTFFSVIAWAVLSDTTRIESPVISAMSKKDAQYQCASKLLEMYYLQE
ncbi:MAG TPA: MBL fold metallo-hydrolase [Chitinispirillaceae bacterium]|nr:MBL fold metallo-hydrolase [Chitinispirillaceae bacterium]